MLLAAFPVGRTWRLPRVIGVTEEMIERNYSTADIIASAREWTHGASVNMSEKALAEKACRKIDSSRPSVMSGRKEI